MKKTVFGLLAVLAAIYFSPVIASVSAANDHKTAHKTEDVKNKDAHHGESHGEKSSKNGHPGGHHAPHLDGKNISLFWAIPFAAILLSIALFPLLAPHFWHHNYGKISLIIGVIFFLLFTIFKGASMSFFYLLEVYLLEFIPFIVLLLALFTVAGGIRLKGELVGSPKLNVILILIGTALASWMGTTGAAMLLIRPILRANAWRKYRTHVVVFFIFLVANIGGSLTPLGDPPLFLGFLKGVDFTWTLTAMLPPMLVAVAILITVFFIMDTYFYKKEPGEPEKTTGGEKLGLEGSANLLLLPLIPVSFLVASMKLGNAFTVHHVSMPTASLLQVSILLVITVASLIITKKEVREANEFTWEPILEVAKLFATIFITMVPPIAMLKAGAEGPLGAIIRSLTDANGQFINANFFWSTGILSSFLDNAPTYLVFFNTAGGNAAELMGPLYTTLLAISVGAVFMGANTYIGNAPNFMVKSIAEESGVPMPSFFGYLIKYSLTILIPTFIIITLIFF